MWYFCVVADRISQCAASFQPWFDQIPSQSGEMRPAGSDYADAVVSQQLYVFIPLHDSWRVMKRAELARAKVECNTLNSGVSLGRFPVHFLALCCETGWISASGHFLFAQKDTLANERSQTLRSRWHFEFVIVPPLLINQQTSLIWSDLSLL